MFGKEVSLTKSGTSIISKDLTIKGNLYSEGLLEIEGSIDGDINGNVVTLRESANVKGNILTKVLNLKGKFNGFIKSERINISGKANIKGTLEYISLCVEDGATIDGDLKRVNEIKANSKTETKEKPEKN